MVYKRTAAPMRGHKVKLFACLQQHLGEIVTKADLLDQLYDLAEGPEWQEGCLKVSICHLRPYAASLGYRIHGIYGRGYVMLKDVVSAEIHLH